MLVWGGYEKGTYVSTGGSYDPATDTWRGLSLLDAPSPRHEHTMAWTGTEAVVSGGRTGACYNDGARFVP